MLHINGFNTRQKHNVKIVEFQVNPCHPPIKAVCVPSINIKLKLPGLSENAMAFKDKGYILAVP